MSWLSGNQQKASRWVQSTVLACAAFAFVAAADMAIAETLPLPVIAVACIGRDGALAQKDDALCHGLRQALATKYPNARFVVSDTPPPKGNAFVTLETIASSTSSIEARLKWQAASALPVDGPRTRLSISDKDLSQKMRLNFLNRLVQDTALPF